MGVVLVELGAEDCEVAVEKTAAVAAETLVVAEN